MKHEWGIGSWPGLVSDPYIEIHYKTFFHKKKFYNISLAGWYDINESTSTYDRYGFIIIPSAEIGISLPFFKVCRFNAAARTSFYFRKSETDFINASGDYYFKWMGGFIGPNLGIEIIPFKTKKIKLSVFGYIHIGFGYMHRKHSLEDTWPNNDYTGTDKETIGIEVIGIAIRY